MACLFVFVRVVKNKCSNMLATSVSWQDYPVALAKMRAAATNRLRRICTPKSDGKVDAPPNLLNSSEEKDPLGGESGRVVELFRGRVQDGQGTVERSVPATFTKQLGQILTKTPTSNHVF